MRPRPPLAAIACLCVVLAGCGGVPSGDGGARTVNPALDGTPTVSPTPEPWSGPPGVNESVVDSRVLASAHGDALANRSLTVRVETRRTWATNGSVLSDGVQRSYTDGEAQFYRWYASEVPYTLAGNRTADVSYWRNGTVTVQRWGYENGSGELTVIDGGYPENRLFDFDPTGSRAVAELLGRYDLTHAGTVSRDGETLYRLVETSAEQPSVLTRSSVRVRALVTGDGVVRSIAISYRTSVDGSPVTVRTEFRLRGVSETTVPRPDWVNETLASEA